MNRQNSDAKENFLQRRYGVSLGRRYALAAASVVLFSVLGCSQVNSNKSAIAQSSLPQPENPLQKKTVNTDTKIVESSNKFGFKLFSEVLKNDRGGNNIFISPSSVAIALAMTYNGASGSTQQAMAKTLELQGMNLPEINSSYAAALKQLLDNSDTKVQLKIANSLWANQDVSFAPDFIKRTQDFYQAKVSNLNFKDAAASNIINNWVKENTNGKINKIVETIEPNQVLFLINAIYFILKEIGVTSLTKKKLPNTLFTSHLVGGSNTQRCRRRVIIDIMKAKNFRQLVYLMVKMVNSVFIYFCPNRILTSKPSIRT